MAQMATPETPEVRGANPQVNQFLSEHAISSLSSSRVVVLQIYNHVEIAFKMTPIHSHKM